MARINKKNTDIEVSRFSLGDAERLLAFNITKQRIVDLCNVDFDEDMFDEAKNYSTWNRALHGHEVWEGIVMALDGLMSVQTAYPGRYLPADGPPKEELHLWMKQITGAKWWYETLLPDCTLNALNGWFSGRAIGKKALADVKQKVDDWWARLSHAVERAEYASLGRDLANGDRGSGKTANGFDSYFFTKVVEEGMSIDEARELYVDLNWKAFQHHTQLINLADPLDPLTRINSKHDDMHRRHFVDAFDEMVAEEYPKALPSIPPEFDKEPWYEVKQWGDRRGEECPRDLNVSLYGVWYKTKCWRVWNSEIRQILVEHEIVEVSRDGENWRDADEHEKKGWKSGMKFFFEAEYAGERSENSYTQEKDLLDDKVRKLRYNIDRAYKNDRDTAKYEAELNVTYRKIEKLHLSSE